MSISLSVFRNCLFIWIFIGAVSQSAFADCGSIPFYAPMLGSMEIEASGKGYRTASVKLNPLEVTVFEPQQRAIILWNGKEQILLLSTDQLASEATAVLEVIPLPGEPEVTAGSFKTFERAQDFVVRKRTWAVARAGARAGSIRIPADAGRITFQKKIGAHDLTVAEVVDSKYFVEFVQGHLKERYQTSHAPIQPKFVRIIDSYIADGFEWFAFDAIYLDDRAKSRQPIQYRFESDAVYYPMRISSGERGNTKISFLVFSPHGVEVEGADSIEGFKREDRIDVTPADLKRIDPKWEGFFESDESLVLDMWKVEGDIAQYSRDIRAR